MDTKSLRELILARRERRAPRDEDERTGRVALAASEWIDATDRWVRRSQERCGWAPHTTVSRPLAYDIARAALTSGEEPESPEERGLVMNRCVEPIFDGYELACALVGVGGDGTGRALGRGGSELVFASGATRGAEVLRAGPLGEVVAAIVDEATAVMLAPLREIGGRAAAAAFGAGILLHLYEHGVSHPLFAPLVATWRPGYGRGGFSLDVIEVPERRAPPNPALIDAILAAPDDDGPRLVYADWLTEQGDPRGEFIQVQCTLGRTIGGGGSGQATRPTAKGASVEEMKERESALLARYEKLWVAEAPSLKSWQWRRGFVAAGVADPLAFVRALPLLARTPLEAVQLKGVRASQVETIAAAGAHPTLRAVDLSQALSTAAIGVLAAPLFAGVRSLDLHGNNFAAVDAARALARAGAGAGLRALTRLRLGGTRLGDAGLDALAAAPFFARLTRLDLRGNGALGVVGAEAVARAEALEELDLVGVALERGAAEALAAQAAPSLRTVALSRDALPPAVVERLRARFTLVDALPPF